MSEEWNCRADGLPARPIPESPLVTCSVFARMPFRQRHRWCPPEPQDRAKLKTKVAQRLAALRTCSAAPADFPEDRPRGITPSARRRHTDVAVSARRLDNTPATLELVRTRQRAHGARDRTWCNLPRKGVHLWPRAAEARDVLDELLQHKVAEAVKKQQLTDFNFKRRQRTCALPIGHRHWMVSLTICPRVDDVLGTSNFRTPRNSLKDFQALKM